MVIVFNPATTDREEPQIEPNLSLRVPNQVYLILVILNVTPV